MFGNGFIMTTSSSVEGYRIVEQCGIVFGETIFGMVFRPNLELD